MLDDIKYCQECGGPLHQVCIEGQMRPQCVTCGYIVFLDPKVAAVVLIEQKRRLLMVNRGVEPALGEWAFPSGYVDRGESVEDAAVREVKEETGLSVTLNTMVGLYSGNGNPVILVVYDARITGLSLIHI